MSKRAKMKRDAVTPFRDKLWDLFGEQASGMDGADVVLAGAEGDHDEHDFQAFEQHALEGEGERVPVADAAL